MYVIYTYINMYVFLFAFVYTSEGFTEACVPQLSGALVIFNLSVNLSHGV